MIHIYIFSSFLTFRMRQLESSYKQRNENLKMSKNPRGTLSILTSHSFEFNVSSLLVIPILLKGIKVGQLLIFTFYQIIPKISCIKLFLKINGCSWICLPSVNINCHVPFWDSGIHVVISETSSYLHSYKIMHIRRAC